MEASVFGTPILWIVSPSLSVGEALASVLRLHLRSAVVPTQLPDSNVLIIEHRESLTCRLDRQPPRDLINSIIVLDLASTDMLPNWSMETVDSNPLDPGMLLTRYPEIYWVFIVRAKPDLDDMIQRCHFVALDELMGLVPLICRHAAGFRTVFDPTGFRRLAQSQPGTPGKPPSLRKRYGISLEDELSYCTWNAYFLYRQECFTYLVASKAEFLALRDQFRSSDADLLVIEDLELNYSDMQAGPEDPHLCEMLLPTSPQARANLRNLLNDRASAFSPKPPVFRLILSAQRIAPSELPEQRPDCVIRSATKPYRGSYDSKLLDRVRAGRPAARPPFSEWPHAIQRIGARLGAQKDEQIKDAQGHSAPGRRQEIAACLIRRCKRHLESSSTQEEAVHLAVLACEAGRLLQYKTLHMSLEALVIRHRAEVQAECMFMGTSSALNVRARLAEIRNEVKMIVGQKTIDLTAKRWKRNRQYCSAMREICGVLRDIYRRYDQREEEDRLLTAYRTWVRRSYYTNLTGSISEAEGDPVKSGFRFIRLAASAAFWPVWSYLNVIMRGGMYLLVAAAAWIAIYALLYDRLFSSIPEIANQMHQYGMGFWDCCKLSLSVFGGFQSSLDGGMGGSWISDVVKKLEQKAPPHLFDELKYLWTLHVSEMVIGYLHLGVFLAWVFQKFSRK